MKARARVLKTIRSQIDSLRSTLLPRQSGAVEGEAYSIAGESFQRSAGSIVQVTEEGRVIEAPDVKIVEGIAKATSDQRTAELEAILAEGLGAEYLSGSASGTMETSNVSFALTPTISEATGFFLSGNSIICETPGRYVFSVRCSLDGTVTGSDQARCTFGLQKNGVTHQQVSSNPILTTVRYLYKDCGTIVAVIDLIEGDAVTFDATVIATTAFARVDLSVWCVSARRASAGGASVITTKGDLIVGDASGEAERLPVGADGKVLKVVSGLPSWEDSSPDGVFYVTTAAEFTAALEAEVPAGTKKAVWVLNPITITPNVPQGTTYRAALTSDVSIYGDHIDWTASGFFNGGASLYTVRFFNQYVVFNGYNALRAAKVRLLFKRVLFTTQQDYPTTFTDDAVVFYETDYRTLAFYDTGGAPSSVYDPPTNWTNQLWDNTNDSSGGASVITTKGDLIVGDASGEAERLPVGADGKVLKVVSGLPSWEDSSGGTPSRQTFLWTNGDPVEGSPSGTGGFGATAKRLCSLHAGRLHFRIYVTGGVGWGSSHSPTRFYAVYEGGKEGDRGWIKRVFLQSVRTYNYYDQPQADFREYNNFDLLGVVGNDGAYYILGQSGSTEPPSAAGAPTYGVPPFTVSVDVDFFGTETDPNPCKWWMNTNSVTGSNAYYPFLETDSLRVAYNALSLQSALTRHLPARAGTSATNYRNDCVFVYYSASSGYMPTRPDTTLREDSKYYIYGSKMNEPLNFRGGNANTAVYFLNDGLGISTSTTFNAFNGKIFAKRIFARSSIQATVKAGTLYYEVWDNSAYPTALPPVNAVQMFWDNTFKVLPKTIGTSELDDGAVTSAQTSGASGTFTDPDGKTVTVTNGLITSITPPP